MSRKNRSESHVVDACNARLSERQQFLNQDTVTAVSEVARAGTTPCRQTTNRSHVNGGRPPLHSHAHPTITRAVHRCTWNECLANEFAPSCPALPQGERVHTRNCATLCQQWPASQTMWDNRQATADERRRVASCVRTRALWPHDLHRRPTSAFIFASVECKFQHRAHMGSVTV
jgi:hypothetical protein